MDFKLVTQKLLTLFKEQNIRYALISRFAFGSRGIARSLVNKLNPTLIDGKVDMDKLVDFLTQYNEFINHNPRPFKKIIDKDMKL